MNALVAARAFRAMTAMELAARAGIAAPQLSGYETGRVQPTVDVLIRLADALDLDLDYLVGRRDQPRLDGVETVGIVAEVGKLTAHQRSLVRRFLTTLAAPPDTARDRLLRRIAAARHQ